MSVRWDIVAVCKVCQQQQIHIPETSGKYEPSYVDTVFCKKCEKQREYEMYSVFRNGTILILEEAAV